MEISLQRTTTAGKGKYRVRICANRKQSSLSYRQHDLIFLNFYTHLAPFGISTKFLFARNFYLDILYLFSSTHRHVSFL